MPIYEYEAKTVAGEKVKGRMEAVDEIGVTASLRSSNYYPVKIKAYSKAKNVDKLMFTKVKIKDISIFCRQFSVTLSAGISILRALEIVMEQSENVKLKKIIGEVLEEVQKGKSLSESMKKHSEFPDMLINMVGVGEASGTLDNIMERMALYYDKEHRLHQKIRQAMTYPIVVSIFAFLVVIALVTFVLPTFVDMIVQSGGGELPLPTRIVMGLSNVMRNHWLLILLILVLLIIGLRFVIKSPNGRIKMDKFKLNIPVFGKINKKIITAKFARTFGILMGSGLSLIESLNICSDIVGNQVVKGILLAAEENIRKGLTLGDTLSENNIFPAMLTQMIKIGEESGSLDNVLDKTAEFYDGEVETATAQLTTMIEPMIIIVLGFVVGFIIISIILPMFQMYNSVGI